jgi:hypothetical protein
MRALHLRRSSRVLMRELIDVSLFLQVPSRLGRKKYVAFGEALQQMHRYEAKEAFLSMEARSNATCRGDVDVEAQRPPHRPRWRFIGYPYSLPSPPDPGLFSEFEDCACSD